MLLGRSWIHDHRCIPSTWHQFIKVAPMPRKQIRIRAIHKPFLREESYCLHAALFLSKEQVQTIECPPREPLVAVIMLPSNLHAANIPPKQPPVLLKSHPTSLASAAPFPNGETDLVPLPVCIPPPCQGLPCPCRRWKVQQQIEKDNFNVVIAVIPIPTPTPHIRDLCKSVDVRIFWRPAVSTCKQTVIIPRLSQTKVVIPRAATEQLLSQPTILSQSSSSNAMAVTTLKMLIWSNRGAPD